MSAKTRREDVPKDPGTVYLLHFDQPIGDPHKNRGQAQHYVGCSSQLQQRLTNHAHGRTARIVSAVISQGIEWELAAVGVTHRRGMRKIERQVKSWKSARAFCPLCGGSGKLPGTTPYPVELLGFPLRSDLLRMSSPEPAVVIQHPDPLAGVAPVVTEVRAIMEEEKESVGYVPASVGGAIGAAIQCGRMLLARERGRLVGYCWWTETPEEVKIQQVAVLSGWQSAGIGTAFIDRVKTLRFGVLLTCRVRADLRAAAEFWPSNGFREVYREPHESSGSEIIGFMNRNGCEWYTSPEPAKPANESDLPW